MRGEWVTARDNGASTFGFDVGEADGDQIVGSPSAVLDLDRARRLEVPHRRHGDAS